MTKQKTMTKIEDLQNLDFDKIKSDPLKKAVKNLVADYEKEEDKKFFQEAAKENIDKLFSMVKSHSPEAIIKKKDTSGSYTTSDGFKWKLLSKEEAKKRFKDNKEVYGLDRGDESEALIEDTEDFERFDEFGVEQGKEEKKTQKSSGLTKELVRKVIDELTDLGIDLEGEDETIIATTRMDLEEAIDESSDTKFTSQVKKAVESFQDFESDISNTKIKKQAVDSVNKLVEALKMDEPKAKPKKDKRENDKKKSKEILEELKTLEPELEACRATIREYNQKKKEVEGEKPKKTRYTKLKEKLLSLINLMPDNLKKDVNVQRKTEKILLTTHRELVAAWGMNKVKAKPGAEAIKDKFDAMEEKATEKEEAKKPEEKKTSSKKKVPEKPGKPQKPKTSAEKNRNKPAAMKEKETVKLGLMYRDGANYKTHFTHEIDLKAFPKAKSLKVGDEILMGEYGTLPESEFFNSEIHEYEYNEQDDHNILEITEILDPEENEDAKVWNVYYYDKEGELIDQTQVDEKDEKLAWDLFKEFGHKKSPGIHLKWEETTENE